MVFDTLFSTNGKFEASPQMAEGMTTENDGKLVRITLRDGLKWHDGEKVLARDCTASITRWAKRDPFGGTIMGLTDELSAPDDKTIQFKLKKKFSLIPDALGKSGTVLPVMMPERFAKTDAFTAVSEIVGSGPFKFAASERVPGSLVVYTKNEAYVPRASGVADWNSGPKIVHFDRVEWHVIPDSATAAAAMQRGEMDWYESPPPDLLPLLRAAKGIKVEIPDSTGSMMCMRLNHLIAPFDNPEIRRLLLHAIDQSDYTASFAGDDASLQHVPVGVFCPGTPSASNAGMEVLTSKRDYDKVKRDIIAAGYKGERVVVLGATDFPILKGMADVCADMFKKIGLNVDYQAMDWGTVIQRRNSKLSVDKGGWNAFCTAWGGLDQFSPVAHSFMRGQGEAGGIPGWPTSPKIEELRNQWLDASDPAAQHKLAEALQVQTFTDCPYLPLGQVLQPTSYKTNLSGVLGGSVLFWNVKRT
jgi:peptide/nickel transport system substrate-binding protein